MTARWRRVDLRGDGTNHVEDLEQHGLGDGVVEFTDIEGSTRSSSGGGTSGRGGLSRSLTGSGLTTSGRGLGGGGLSLGGGSDVRHFCLVCVNFRGWARFNNCCLLYGFVHV